MVCRYPSAGYRLYAEENRIYMVVQPIVASCVPVMEAKTVGEPPLSEPYSTLPTSELSCARRL